jgi:hypothetical protein
MYSEPIPAGFQLTTLGRDQWLIQHQRTGMGCLNAFLMAWLSGWTMACIAMVYLYFFETPTNPEQTIPLGIVIIFCTADIVVWCFLIYSIFCKQTFQIDYYNLVITTEILALKWDKTIPKNSIRRVVQVQDGGRGRDSFPSWGLKIEGSKKASLIFRQPYEKSYWLGEFLANWAKVEFVLAPQKLVNSRFG